MLIASQVYVNGRVSQSLVPEIRTVLPFSRYKLLSQVSPTHRGCWFLSKCQILGTDISWDQTGGRLSRTKITREARGIRARLRPELSHANEKERYMF